MSVTINHEVVIVNNDAGDFDPFAGGEIGRTAPITPEQEELWLSVQLGGTAANLAYNQAFGVTLRGPLDAARLRRCLDALVERHEALRATLSGDGANLCIAAQASMAFREKDISSLDPDARAKEVAHARAAAVNEEFDLVSGPLVRAQLLRLSELEHVLILVAHHLICDGSSAAILMNELAELYSAKTRGVAPNLPPATPFSEYARMRSQEARTREATADLRYWLEQYRTLPPALELPLDFPRPPERTFAADRSDVALPPALVRSLKATSARHGTSLATLLFAAFQAFVHRITGQRSFAVVLPVAGQSISGMKTVVGHCVRSLPIRAQVDPKQPFHEHLLLVKKAMLDGIEHPRITFGGLVKELPLTRDPSRIPLAAIVFNVDSNAAQAPFEGLEVSIESLPRSNESFELFPSVNVCGDGAVIEASFSTRLFSKATIEGRMAEFVALLEAVTQDATQRIGELEIMPAEQRQAVLVEVNRTEAELPTETLCARFRAQARREPERTAVRSGGRALTYGQLDRASAALAERLIAQGVAQGGCVGVFLPRSVELLVALLGILRAGAAYVPLDPQYPSERLEFIAADAKLSLLVTDAELSARLPAGTRAVFVEPAAEPTSLELDDSRLSAAAYMIYTSGSTGKPKGVVVEHRNAANLLASVAKKPGLCSSDVLLAITTPCFDISVVELFLPLTMGAQVVIATQDEVLDGVKLGKLVANSQATFMQATPAGWRVLLDAGWQGQRSLKAVTAGEALTNELATELMKRVASLWNCYGPTETTVYSTLEQVGQLPATIGRAVDNTRVYVLDANLRPVPPGVAGELYIGGAGVARGYHARPELTAERFVKDPFADRADARMYKTGDLARFRWDGRLEWLGRNDFQVKVRGYRIELGEVEARLAECTAVREGVVIVREDRPGDQRIVAYVRPQSESEPSEQRIRDELRARLPSFMVPQHVVVLSSFPLTPNGKVDRKALPAPEGGSNSAYRAPETDLEVRLAKEFADLLGTGRVGLDDDFFALGGHSMLALRLVARVLRIAGVEVPMRVVFSTPTLKGLADFISAALVVQRGSGVRATTSSQDREELVL